MKEINLGGKKLFIIELTEPISENSEPYPGDPKIEKEVFSEINKTGYEHYTHKIGDHSFHPHADAPKHQNVGGDGIESFGMDFFFNDALLIDLSELGEEVEGIKYIIEVKLEHLKKFSDKLKGKGAVVIRTGYDKWIEANKKHNPEKLPYLTKEAAEFIAGFENIRVVGTDSLTVDKDGCHDSHKALREKMIVECMVHLDEINNKEFFLISAPIRIKGASGAPVAAYAILI